MTMQLRPGWRLAIALGVFQGAWFICIVSAAREVPGIGVAAVAAAVLLHCAMSPARGQELVLIALAMIVGLCWDTTLGRAGIVLYASPGPWPGWAPPWILSLWALFATALREPLRWLHGRWLLAAALGGAGGAASYASAQRLGACRLPDETFALLVLALGWAVITPVLTEFAAWLDRRAPAQPVRRINAS